MLAAAEGMYYTSPTAGEILDGTAGLWCVNAGQAARGSSRRSGSRRRKLDFAPAFQMGHPKAFELAARLAAMLPGRLDHVFFTNSGSESVETALKIALAYQRAIGQGRAPGSSAASAAIMAWASAASRSAASAKTGSSSARCCPASIICPTPMTSRTTRSPRAAGLGRRARG